jgi:benzylsuccinate CoA-transferase BbsF subunit
MTKRALEGVKVLEFAYLGITPMTGKLLGTNGATVVRVESKTRLDPLRNSGPYIDGIVSLEHSAEVAHVHSDKYGITLNLKLPQSIEIAKKLIAWADIITDGFTTGALDRMGFGYESCKKINPDIIMLSSNTFGQTGPRSTLPSTGIQLTGMTGFTELSGWADREPISLGYYSDFVLPHFSLISVLAALDYKRRTGKGQHLDIAQCEASLYFIAPPILDYVVNNRLGKRHGNRSPYASPHGVYRCKGEDRWCAISVVTDDEWSSFCKAIGNPRWTQDSRFAILLGRKKDEDALDKLIEDFTSNQPAEEVMRIMQANGVAAGVVQTGEEVFNDPQLNHYGYFKWLFYPGIERELPTQLPFVKLSKTPAEVRMPRPIMGEHNEYVCTQILGISDEEFVKLITEGVFE